MTPSCVFWFQPHFLKPKDSKTQPVKAHKSTSASACLKAKSTISLDYIWETKVGQLRTQSISRLRRARA